MRVHYYLFKLSTKLIWFKLLLNKFVVFLDTVFTTQLQRALQIHTLVAIFIRSEIKDIHSSHNNLIDAYIIGIACPL